MTWIRVVSDGDGGEADGAPGDGVLCDPRTKAILDALMADDDRSVLIVCSDGETVIEIRGDGKEVPSTGHAPVKGLGAVLCDIRSILSTWNACLARSRSDGGERSRRAA